jgi:hypothetical protein
VSISSPTNDSGNGPPSPLLSEKYSDIRYIIEGRSFAERSNESRNKNMIEKDQNKDGMRGIRGRAVKEDKK